MLQRHLLFRQMRDVLASLYLDKDSAERVAKDAGLDPRWIAFSTRAVDNWEAILEEAEKNKQIPVLLDVAVAQYSQKHELLDARTAYQVWEEAGRPLTERERQLQTLANTYHLAPPEDGGVSVTPSLLPRLEVVLNRHILFGGRDKELARLDALLTERPNGYLLVTGLSGFGKTALLANWIKALRADHQSVCYHFINRSEGLADEKFVMQNLCEQLAAYHGLRGTLPIQETTLRALYPQLLRLPLEASHKLVVVLDGLDEALDWNPGSDLFPLDLPVGIYVVFSGRAQPNVDWLATLEVSTSAADPLELKTLGLHEIESLLHKVGGNATGLAEDADFVKAVYNVSHGDPFYLHFLVQDIQEGDITSENVEDQPDGLDKYLEKWWEQLAADVDIREVYDLLGILSVAKGRLLPKDFAGISPNLSQGALLKKELNSKLRRYLTGDRASGYAIAHPRFGVYLIEEQFEEYEVQGYLDQMLAYCAGWREHRSVYTLTYYVQHLADAVEQNDQPSRGEFTERLIKLTSDRTFQEMHVSIVNDLPALQADLERALRAAADNRGRQALPLVVESALTLVDFRLGELRPEPIFELARKGAVETAKRRLELFDIDFEWRQAILLTIAWLGLKNAEGESRRLFEEVQAKRPIGEPLGALWDWVSASLHGTPQPVQNLDLVSSENQVRLAIERMTDSGSPEVPHQEGLGTMGLGELGYLAKQDGPNLVAFAWKHPEKGNDYFDRYVTMHTGYSYAYYRNRSLWILLDSVVRHPLVEWVQNTVVKLATAAMAGSRTDFREGLPITIRALQAKQTKVHKDFEKQLRKAKNNAKQLSQSHRQGDITGEHKRRLAVLAEVLAFLLYWETEVDDLLLRAQELPYGFAGYGMPAYLALAEAVRVCKPENWPAIEQALNAAQEAAHNIQDAIFCARSTARFNAMQEFWWQPTGIRELPQVAKDLRADPMAPKFTALHRVGEGYDRRRWEGKIRLPPEMYDAHTLQALADVYRRPVTEFQRLNREQEWAVDQVLSEGTPVYVPDPGFAPLLAARFAAEALVEPSLPPSARQELIQTLVPVAVANATTLDLVLARLLLADPPSEPAILTELERLSAYPTETSQLVKRPLGIPS